MLENSERSVRGVRMGKSGPLKRVELANQIQGFRIPDRWDASEKIISIIFITSYKLHIKRQRHYQKSVIEPEMKKYWQPPFSGNQQTTVMKHPGNEY